MPPPTHTHLNSHNGSGRGIVTVTLAGSMAPSIPRHSAHLQVEGQVSISGTSSKGAHQSRPFEGTNLSLSLLPSLVRITLSQHRNMPISMPASSLDSCGEKANEALLPDLDEGCRAVPAELPTAPEPSAPAMIWSTRLRWWSRMSFISPRAACL